MKPTAVKSLPLALLIISLATFSSCKKDKDAPAISIQSISGSYKLGAWTYQENQMPPDDLIQYMDDCEKDDIINFKTDKTFTNTDAGVQCMPPGGYNGDWDLPSTTKIILDGEEHTLDSFDGTTLKVSQSETLSGVTEVYRMTLVKQ
jgi:hypothetical protein